MVVVVVAVSKASSGRAWQSSSSYLYIYSILLKRIRSRVFFWCVFGELLARFFLLFLYFFRQKTQHVEKTDRHTLHRVSSKVYVCVRACLWCDCRLKGTI